jgi:hypothetical protein
MINWISMVGYIAALLVGTTFYMKSMIHLRCFAIASNVCFMIYAYFHSPQLYPVLILHAFLLPLNINRLWELRKQAPGNKSLLVKNEWSRNYLRPAYHYFDIGINSHR